MSGLNLVVDGQVMGAALFGLLMFGLAYNALVTWIGERKEGYTSLLVAFGVLVTLIGAALVSWQAALWIVLCFVASGTPMIVGDILRYVRRREQAIEDMRRAIERMAPAEGADAQSSKPENPVLGH